MTPGAFLPPSFLKSSEGRRGNPLGGVTAGSQSWAVPAPCSHSPGTCSCCRGAAGPAAPCLQLAGTAPSQTSPMGRGGCGAWGWRAWSWARLPAPHGLFLVPCSTGMSRRAARLAPEGVNYREFEASAQRLVLIGA